MAQRPSLRLRLAGYLHLQLFEQTILDLLLMELARVRSGTSHFQHHSVYSAILTYLLKKNQKKKSPFYLLLREILSASRLTERAAIRFNHNTNFPPWFTETPYEKRVEDINPQTLSGLITFHNQRGFGD